MPSDSAFTEETLSSLYAKLSAPSGATIAALRDAVDAFSAAWIERDDLQAFREGRGVWKKLHDEVFPIAHFLTDRYPANARIRFPLDDQPPDAWLTVGSDSAVGIEVTAALGRAGDQIAGSLAKGGAVPGFIGLQDDVPSQRLAAVRARGRVLHSAKGVKAAIDQAIVKRLAAKDQAKFTEQILLITAPLGSSPDRSAQNLIDMHGKAAAELPFSQVHVIDTARPARVVQLK